LEVHVRAPLIVLTGPPGAGKTTVAPAVADAFAMAVHLRADEFWHAIHKPWVAPYLAGSERQNAVVMDAATAAACRYALGGYAVVLDGIVGPWFIDVFIDAATAAGLALHYVILRPTSEIALARATARRAGELVNPVPVRKVHEAFGELGRYERHVVDTSGLDAAATAEVVLSELRSGRFRLVAATHEVDDGG
jgi:predicted kinase